MRAGEFDSYCRAGLDVLVHGFGVGFGPHGGLLLFLEMVVGAAVADEEGEEEGEEG